MHAAISCHRECSGGTGEAACHRWAIAPQYIEQFRTVLSIFKAFTPTIQRDCSTMPPAVPHTIGEAPNNQTRPKAYAMWDLFLPPEKDVKGETPKSTRRMQCTFSFCFSDKKYIVGFSDGAMHPVLWFGVVALCFVTTTRALRSVLGKTIVMVLLCHSSECGCFLCYT